jgi:hypothetical protein
MDPVSLRPSRFERCSEIAALPENPVSKQNGTGSFLFTDARTMNCLPTCICSARIVARENAVTRMQLATWNTKSFLMTWRGKDFFLPEIIGNQHAVNTVWLGSTTFSAIHRAASKEAAEELGFSNILLENLHQSPHAFSNFCFAHSRIAQQESSPRRLP